MNLEQTIQDLYNGPVGRCVGLQDGNGQEHAVLMSIDTFEQMKAQLRQGTGFVIEREAPLSRRERKARAARKLADEKHNIAYRKRRRQEEHERNRAAKLRKKMPKTSAWSSAYATTPGLEKAHNPRFGRFSLEHDR